MIASRAQREEPYAVARPPANTPARKATAEDLHRITDWQFAILRLAVMPKHTDRALVMARIYKSRHHGAPATHRTLLLFNDLSEPPDP